VATTSPFTPEQKILIYAGTGLLVLFSCWLALRALREHFRTRNRLRIAPLTLVPFTILVAVWGAMVANAHPFFIQHPVRIPSFPGIGMLLVLAAVWYDQLRSPSAEKSPSRVVRFRTRIETSFDSRHNYPPDKPLLAHLKSLIRFYFGSREVRIISRYPLEEALSRIRNLPRAGEVYVSLRKPDTLTVCAAQVRGNVLPMFRGTLAERNGKVTLEGRVDIDSGIVCVLGLFAFALFVFLPLSTIFSNASWPERLSKLVGPFAGLLMMEFGYFISKNSAEIIVRNLNLALRG
jgi:hypothetical protein